MLGRSASLHHAIRAQSNSRRRKAWWTRSGLRWACGFRRRIEPPSPSGPHHGRGRHSAVDPPGGYEHRHGGCCTNSPTRCPALTTAESDGHGPKFMGLYAQMLTRYLRVPPDGILCRHWMRLASRSICWPSRSSLMIHTRREQHSIGVGSASNGEVDGNYTPLPSPPIWIVLSVAVNTNNGPVGSGTAWSCEHRVFGKVKATSGKANPRFVVIAHATRSRTAARGDRRLGPPRRAVDQCGLLGPT